MVLQPTPQSEIAIIGGGICGLTLALALAKHAIKSTVYERGRGEQALGGMLSMEPNAMSVFDRLGVRADLEAVGIPYQGYGVYLPNGDLKTRMMVSSRLPSVRIERHRLQQLLQGLAQKSEHITLNHQHLLCAIETKGDRAELTFENGVKITPEFVVAADGIKSFVRRQYDPDSASLPYIGIVSGGVFTTESEIRWPDNKPKETPYVQLNATPGELIGVSHTDPTQPDRVFVFYNKKLDAKSAVEIENMDDPAEAVKKLWKDQPDPMKSVLESGNFSGPVPWVVRTVPSGKPWRAGPEGRVLYVGDAVHAVPPFTGQGAALSIEDAELLARVFAESGSLDAFVKERTRRVAEVVDIKLRALQSTAPPEDAHLVTDYDSTKVSLSL